MAADKKIIILGGGNMGSGLAKGLLENQWHPQSIMFCEQDQARRDWLSGEFPLSNIIQDCTSSLPAIDIIVLAIKPQDMRSVCQLLAKQNIDPNTLFISIAAGVPVTALQRWLGKQALTIRCMPNIPAAIGQGVTGIFAQPTIDVAKKELAEEILRCTGQVLWVDDETLLDAVTALSGSGPAYLFYFMECLQESGQALGLSEQASRELSLQTVLGAVQLAAQQDEDFMTLRAQVTSPKGTTEQAINYLIKHEFKKIMDEAIKAAASRASAISHSFDED